jgi:Uncharacterised protein family (UPF0261)
MQWSCLGTVRSARRGKDAGKEAFVMGKTVVLVGALDTKGAEFDYVRQVIRRAGLDVLTVDFGVLGEPALVPDVGSAEVALAGGGDLERWRAGQHKDEAMAGMAAGLAVVVRRLYDQGRLDGIVSMGGSGGTSIATTAMRTLPVGVPKLVASTVGGGDVSGYAGTKDITFMPSIVDIAGFNRISRRIYANAAEKTAIVLPGCHRQPRAESAPFSLVLGHHPVKLRRSSLPQSHRPTLENTREIRRERTPWSCRRPITQRETVTSSGKTPRHRLLAHAATFHPW